MYADLIVFANGARSMLPKIRVARAAGHGCEENTFMRYGYFDDENREYVITTPRTPLPWINYLGSEDFFSLVSNTAGGYSFYRDAKLLRLTRYRYNSAPADGEGHRFYIRDGACVWNPGWQPVRTELDSYRCRHGLGYTVIEGAKKRHRGKAGNVRSAGRRM